MHFIAQEADHVEEALHTFFCQHAVKTIAVLYSDVLTSLARVPFGTLLACDCNQSPPLHLAFDTAEKAYRPEVVTTPGRPQ